MTSLLLQTPNELYGDMERLIQQTVHRHQAKYGGDFEELLGLAHEFYVKAFNSHDWHKGRFSTWIVFLISHQLIDHKRKEAMRAQTLARRFRWDDGAKIELNSLGYEPSGFNVTEFLEVLSEDARGVVEMVLSGSSGDLKLALVERSSGSARSIRSAIREVLKDFGWESHRITNCFNEITEALQC